ncbi:hypothetical protein [Bacteroides thetaiotaomicron]|uniref:hypothetical protein n=1 Tax=Bacteroides thetaiotaomicron TaxID=818 RepID=UPI0034A0FDC2
MKKYIIFCLLSIISFNMLAQVYHMRNKYENIPQDILSNIDKMGMDDSSFLTELEGKYLNTVAGISEKDFNFSKSKVAFFRGNIGSIRSSKKEYFRVERECLKVCTDSILLYFGTLYIFDAKQKVESGGYDAAIVDRSKKLLSTKEVVRQLKKKR